MVSEYSLMSKVLGQHHADEFDTLTPRMVSEYSLMSKVLRQHHADESDRLAPQTVFEYSLISKLDEHTMISGHSFMS